MVKYRTIVADPPWHVKRPAGWATTRPSRPLTYPTMTVDAIAALPVATMAADTAYLFLWTINRYVEQSYAVARTWGFRPVTLLTWCKPPGRGTGGAFAQTAEFVLYARRGTDGDNGRRQVARTSWFMWPRRAHSVKPDALADLIEANFPGPYLEMFARRNRLGWDTWGNEALEHVEITA